MDARLSKTDIEKLVKRHLPHTTARRWEGGDLILEIDIDELRREEIKGNNVWLFSKEVKIGAGNYAVCPIIRGDKAQYFLVIQ